METKNHNKRAKESIRNNLRLTSLLVQYWLIDCHSTISQIFGKYYENNDESLTYIGIDLLFDRSQIRIELTGLFEA